MAGPERALLAASRSQVSGSFHADEVLFIGRAPPLFASAARTARVVQE